MPVKVNGVAVGSLEEAHRWAHDNKPRSVTIAAYGTIGPMARGLTWTYSAPLEIDGGRFRGDGGSGNGAPGWWLVYRPTLPPSSQDRPIEMPFVLNGVKVEGFVRGGLNLCPATSDDVNAGGEKVWLEGVKLNGCSFSKIGTRWSLDDSTQAVGYGAVFAQGTHGMTVTGCTFESLVNDPLDPPIAGTYGESLIHALYLDDYCVGTKVTGSTFRHISGDAIRVRNGSHVDVVGNTFERAGWTANVSSWRNVAAGEAKGTAELRNNKTDNRGFTGRWVRSWDPYR